MNTLETPFLLRQIDCLCHLYIVSDNNSHGISRTRCFLNRSFWLGRRNSVSCTIPYGVMQEPLFLPPSDNELYNLHAQTAHDTFLDCDDIVSCFMSFDILSDVFWHYSGISGLKFSFFTIEGP